MKKTFQYLLHKYSTELFYFIFSTYFVKYSWGWTLILVGPFAAVTGYTTSCGQKEQLRAQAFRLVMATGIWYFATSLFLTIEDNSGICNVTKFLRKTDCLKNGFRWKGFDISGHTFLLTFANLFILEEGKAYLGWERIKVCKQFQSASLILIALFSAHLR